MIFQLHHLFILQCMMGAMDEFWLLVSSMHCNMRHFVGLWPLLRFIR